MRKTIVSAFVILSALACTVPEPPLPPPIPGVEVLLKDPGRNTVGSLMGPASSMIAHMEEDMSGVHIRAELRRDGLGVEVRVQNWGSAPVQLLLQEWSLTAEGETSPVVTGDIPNAQVQGACIGPVTLPEGGVYNVALVMRKMHGLYGGRYALEPMRGDVVLVYVISADAGRRVSTLRLKQNSCIREPPFHPLEGWADGRCSYFKSP